MQHILHIVPRLNLGGTAKELVMLGRGLSRSDILQQVCVLTSTRSALEWLDRGGIQSTLIGSRGEFDPVALWRLVRSTQRLAPSILHIWPPVDSALAWGLTRLSGACHTVVTLPKLGG